MSEPVSNAEVEDVLASIRRLVSEEKRPSGTSAFDAPSVSNLASDVAVETRSKLVLTPALRVAQPVEDQPQPASVEQANKDDEKSVAEQEPDDQASSTDAKLENVTDDFADEPVDPPSLTAADTAEETVESAQDHIDDAPFMMLTQTKMNRVVLLYLVALLPRTTRKTHFRRAIATRKQSHLHIWSLMSKNST